MSFSATSEASCSPRVPRTERRGVHKVVRPGAMGRRRSGKTSGIRHAVGSADETPPDLRQGYIIIYHTILYYIILYYTALYFIHTKLLNYYITILYYIVLYYTGPLDPKLQRRGRCLVDQSIDDTYASHRFDLRAPGGCPGRRLRRASRTPSRSLFARADGAVFLRPYCSGVHKGGLVKGFSNLCLSLVLF